MVSCCSALASLNDIADLLIRLAVIHVPDAEVHFRADEWLDAKSAQQPVVYISPNDIYALHSAIVENLDVVVSASLSTSVTTSLISLSYRPPSRRIQYASSLENLEERPSPLRASSVLLEQTRFPFSSLPGSASPMVSPLLAFFDARTDLCAIADPRAEDKALFAQAKRRIVAVLKVHHGADLVAIFAQPVTQQDEEAWHRIVQEEVWEEQRQARAARRSIIAPVDDLRR